MRFLGRFIIEEGEIHLETGVLIHHFRWGVRSGWWEGEEPLHP